MDKELCKIILMNKNKEDCVELVFYYLLMKNLSNLKVECLFAEMKQSSLSYLKNTFSVENCRRGNFKGKFNGYLEEYRSVHEDFKNQSTEIKAFLLKKAFENLDNFILLVLLMKQEDLEKFLPGICTFSFKILEEREVEEKIILILAFLLSQNIKVDDVSKGIISDFFIRTSEPIFAPIWYILSYDSEIYKVKYILKLILNNFSVRKEDYELIRLNINNVFSVELVEKLMSVGEFEFDNKIFEKIKELYQESGRHENLIILLQEKYQNEIENPVYELLPVGSQDIEYVLTNCRRNNVKKYLKRINLEQNGYEIAKFYLSDEDKVVCKVIEEEFDVREIVGNNEMRIFEWLFVQIEQKVLIYQGIIEKIYLSSKTEEKSLLIDLCKEKCKTEQRLISLIDITTRFLSIVPSTNLQDLVYSLLSVLYIIDDAKLALKMLNLVKSIMQNNGNLKREFLKFIFDEILYFEIDSCEIRICKYEIFNILLIRWFVIEESIKHQRDVPLTKLRVVERLKDVHIQTYENYLSLHKSAKVSERNKVDLNKENIHVLCARIWEEIAVEPEDGELEMIVELLKTIIALTGTFYQKRFISSLLLRKIVAYYCSVENESYLDFIKILNLSFTCSREIKKLTEKETFKPSRM